MEKGKVHLSEVEAPRRTLDLQEGQPELVKAMLLVPRSASGTRTNCQSRQVMFLIFRIFRLDHSY